MDNPEEKKGYPLDFVIQKFFEEKDRTCRSATIRDYENLLKNILEFFKSSTIINNLKKIDIKNYENFRLLNGVKEGLLIKELKLLKTIFNFAEENEFIDNNFFRSYNFLKIYHDYEKRERFLTPEECQRLINNANPYLQRLIIFLLETGMRINETLNLYFSDITPYTIDKFGNKIKVFTLRVRPEISKSKKERFIPLSIDAMEQVKKQKIDFPNSMFIFTDSKGNYYKTTPKKAFENARNKSNLKGVSFHTLRHTCATLKNKGLNYKGVFIGKKDKELIKRILGHSDLKITDGYIHNNSIDDLIDFIE